MINEPLVTILIPVYNGGKYLDLTIRKLLEQTYQNIEIIILLTKTFHKQMICIRIRSLFLLGSHGGIFFRLLIKYVFIKIKFSYIILFVCSVFCCLHC